MPGNVADLRPLHEAGVFGFKCFLLPSGVDEFPAPDDGRAASRRCAEIADFDGLLIVHAEDPASIEPRPAPRAAARYADFLASRPRGAENPRSPGCLDAARRDRGAASTSCTCLTPTRCR